MRARALGSLLAGLAVLTLVGCDPHVTPGPTPTVSAPRVGVRAPVPGAFNPAVTAATVRSTICVAGWTARVRPSTSYTTALKRRQLARLGYADRDPGHYEEDHLVPLALGGAPSDERNLWPEPWSAARVKDKDEVRLHRAVCGGTMTLVAARAEILRLWGPA